jgi:type IV pilus assembly protein PilE
MKPARAPLASGLHGGWTFIEIMVVVAILAILLAIAVPSYRHYLQRGDRAEAVRALLRVADCQERLRAVTGRYDTTRCLPEVMPLRYEIGLAPEAETESLVYRVRATPRHPDRADYCGELTIDQAGTRGIGGVASRLADCWGGR